MDWIDCIYVYMNIRIEISNKNEVMSYRVGRLRVYREVWERKISRGKNYVIILRFKN